MNEKFKEINIKELLIKTENHEIEWLCPCSLAKFILKNFKEKLN